jgi:Glucose / Sorbosone dehydrogenase
MKKIKRLASCLMHLRYNRKIILSRVFCVVPIIFALSAAEVVAAPQALRADITVRKILDTVVTPITPALRSIRLVKSPNRRYLIYLKLNGDIYRVDLLNGSQVRLFTAAQHQVMNAQGMAIGATGNYYLVGNEDLPNNQTRAKIVKGVFDPVLKIRIWSTLAVTVGYPKSNTAFDHRFNGIVVAPAGDFIYVNSGSRTDHGEIQTAGGLYPNRREVGLTACILRLPTSGTNILLPNNRATLRSAGYIFAEGTRNTFDMAFAPNGDLFGTENGPDRDMAEELNWLRPGLHYGFPWRIGGQDNPQQFADYDPTQDLLLDKRFTAVKGGFYHHDPTFPKRPVITLVEPIVNLGPDADSFRDPVDGLVKDASSLGRQFSTFTTHRSPLGLVFDRARAMSPEFNGDGFMLSWTLGDPLGQAVAGPFQDASQDLLNLNLTKIGQINYQLQATRIVGGFNHPIDAEIIGNKIYVLEYGGTQGIWEVTLPPKI